MGKMGSVFLQNCQNQNTQCSHVGKKKNIKETNSYKWPVANGYFSDMIKRLLTLHNKEQPADNPPQAKMINILKRNATWPSIMFGEKMMNFVILNLNPKLIWDSTKLDNLFLI